MAKLGLLALALSFVGIIGAASMAPQEATAGAACKTTTFKSKDIAAACQKGGQADAKKAMKKFLKAAKKKQANLECGSCHSKLAPKYELKTDAFDKYKQLGGK